MKALVTGASGFVGQYLVRHLLDSGDSVVACHNIGEDTGRTPILVDHPEHDFVISRAEWVPLSIADCDAVAHTVSRVRPDVIYHLAGIAFVPEAEENFGRALQINVEGTYNIYRACERARIDTTIVLVSSAEVYGRVSLEDLPISEDNPIRPGNNYSLSKIMAESVSARFLDAKNIRSVIVRPFNHIGAGQNERFVAPNFARQLAQIVRSGSVPVLRVGNLESRRDFTDVRDIVRAYRLAALKGSGTYNLGSGKAVSIELILRMLIEAADLNVTLETDPERMRPSEVPEVRADISRAQRELGWTPAIELRDTLKDIYQHAYRLATRAK